MSNDQTMTLGQRYVGLSFNPGSNPEVHSCKVVFAGIIDDLMDIRTKAIQANDGEKARLCSLAITEAQTAQMWAVKAITWGT